MSKRFEKDDKVYFRMFDEEATFVKYNNNGTATIILSTGTQVDTTLDQLKEVVKKYGN